MNDNSRDATLQIGWGQADLTPMARVRLCGQFSDRLSEGVLDPITATALAFEGSGDQVVMASCDLAGIPDQLRDQVRAGLRDQVPGLDPDKVILHATHTHDAPDCMPATALYTFTADGYGVDLPAFQSAADYRTFAAERIIQAVRTAWSTRAPGQITFGLGHAVVGRNRRWVSDQGLSTMYGNTDTPAFSHIEGYEDHSLGVLATRDGHGRLTGLVVNVPCPSQETETLYQISADYWHETRQELRRRLGETLFILPQCSAAGDQSPHLLYDKRAETRMLQLAGRTSREEIAMRIADAVERVLQILGNRADAVAPLRHRVQMLQLPAFKITAEQARTAAAAAQAARQRHQEELRKLQTDPSLRAQPYWYGGVTSACHVARWNQSVVDRYEHRLTASTVLCETHVIRIGDVAVATNPFEYYLDYGVYIKARSPAQQTFLVQLAGEGGYLSTVRASRCGGYGSVPGSSSVDPEGGPLLAAKTVEAILACWQ